VHRVLKSGCKVVERQLQSLERLRPMIAINLLSACYLMGLCAAARQTPAASALERIRPVEAEALIGFCQQSELRAQTLSYNWYRCSAVWEVTWMVSATARPEPKCCGETKDHHGGSEDLQESIQSGNSQNRAVTSN